MDSEVDRLFEKRHIIEAATQTPELTLETLAAHALALGETVKNTAVVVRALDEKIESLQAQLKTLQAKVDGLQRKQAHG